MPETEVKTTSPNQPEKRKQPALNYLLLLVLIAMVAWCFNTLLNQSKNSTNQASLIATDSHIIWRDEVNQLQNAVKSLDERIHSLESKLAEQDAKIIALESSPQSKPSVAGEAIKSGFIGSLETRIIALENRTNEEPLAASAFETTAPQTLKSLEARLAAIESQGVKNNSVESARLAKLHAFYLLQSAIFAGKPYSAEYIGFADLVSENDDIAEALDLLNSYAEDGIPSQQNLTKEFMEIARQSLQTTLPENAGFYERLKHNLTSLVSIRKVGEHQQGLEKQAIIARCEASLKKGELEAAVTEIQSMNVSDQALFSSWLEDAKVRLEIPATLSQIQETLLKSQQEPSGEVSE